MYAAMQAPLTSNMYSTQDARSCYLAFVMASLRDTGLQPDRAPRIITKRRDFE